MSADIDEIDQTELGKVTWHSSEEDSGPDVGLMLGLGEGRALWVGEISKRAWTDAGSEIQALGSDGGWWLGIYQPEFQPFAKFADAEAGREVFEQIANSVRATLAHKGAEP